MITRRLMLLAAVNVLAIVFGTTGARAITWEVIGACSATPIATGASTADLDHSMGDYTLKVLEAAHISYVGTEGGINSIANSPMGDEALEVLSDVKMRAYGWCVQIDGIEPDLMPDDTYFPRQTSHLRWFAL